MAGPKITSAGTVNVSDTYKSQQPVKDERPKDYTSSGQPVDEGNAPPSRDIAKEIAAAPKFIYGKDDAWKQAVAQRLTAAGYVVSNWKNIEELVGQYQKALSDNQLRNTNFGINQTLDELIDTKISEGGGADGGPSVNITTSISAPTEAASAINQAFKANLGRDATAEEIAKYTVDLNKAEKKAVSKSVSTKKGGVTSTTYSGGLDKAQFLNDIVKTLPEFVKRKEEARSITGQSLLKTIQANGLNNYISQDQISEWNKAVENGKDIDVVKNEIRNIAANGFPDHIKKMLNSGIDLATVYAPYKGVMASTLELAPDAIDLNDPTLRNAIGPDKEMSIYDFQKALRKDSRWQYTNNAKDEVASSVTKVLQDFGFQG